MRRLLTVEGKSQYEHDIKDAYRPSACGPVTVFVILRYLFAAEKWTVNELYERLGSTKIGLFTWRFIRNLRKLLGSSFCVEKCTLEEALQQLQNGQAVAAKFDRWFSLHWRGNFAFNYHWVPVIGYERTNDELYLYVHDNGSSHSPSTVRKVSYQHNQSILTFVKIEPNNAKIK